MISRIPLYILERDICDMASRRHNMQISQPVETGNIEWHHEHFILNILTWNIGGLQKFKECDNIKDYFRKFNIVCLCETWSKLSHEFDHFLNGYINVREMGRNRLRNSGGMSVFGKECIVENCYIKIIFCNFEKCVELLFRGSLFNSMKILSIILHMFHMKDHRYMTLFIIKTVLDCLRINVIKYVFIMQTVIIS